MPPANTQLVKLEPDEQGNVHIPWDRLAPWPPLQWWLPVPPEQEAMMDALFPQRLALRGGPAAPQSAPATVPALPPVRLADREYFDLDEAAEYTRLAPGTLSNAVSAGDLTKTEGGGTRAIFKRTELDRFMATKRPKPTKEKPTKEKPPKKKKRSS